MEKARVEKAMQTIVSEIGCGLRESIYQNALAVELRLLNHKVKLEQNETVIYKGQNIGTVRLDMIVDDKVIIEFKAVQKITKKEKLQLENYLRITGLNFGFLINVSTDDFMIELISLD